MHELGPAHDLFDGFELWSYENLEPYLRHISKLRYKSSGDYWVVAQAARSIFAPPSQFE